MTANQVEHYAAVDVASRFARCHLKVAQINLSHLNLLVFQLNLLFAVIAPVHQTDDLDSN